MKYFNVECSVPGPYVQTCPMTEADGLPSYDPAVIITKRAEANLQIVAAAVEAAFKEAGVTLRHAYAWPDGSLYYYAAKDSELTIADLPEEAQPLIAKISEVDGWGDPSKYRYSTIAEYLAVEPPVFLTSAERLQIAQDHAKALEAELAEERETNTSLSQAYASVTAGVVKARSLLEQHKPRDSATPLLYQVEALLYLPKDKEGAK
jgi:hypothetical protein